MSVNVDFYYDFGSPNAYLAQGIVPDIENRTGVRFTYVPCLIGGIFKATGNKPPFVMFKDVKGKLDYDRIEFQRFIRRHGLTDFTFNPHFPVNTLLLMRGAVAAEMDGVHSEYIAAGMRAMWEQGLKMDDPDVFAETLTAAGLNGAGLLARTQDAEVKQRLAENTEAAVNRGVFGIPTFFVGDEMFFGKERLDQVEEEIVKQSGQGA